jgi:EAL domain-containing protein (putative c-di-GMP-specific phosphodiesterase class I)
VAAVLQLIESAGLQAIVEGIETAEQVAQLRRLGCRFGQGYYFARPLPAEETVALLNSPLPSA